MMIELAKFSPTKRGFFVTRDKLDKIEKKGSNYPFYRSVYLYRQEDTKNLKSVKNFFGIRDIDIVPIDIDKQDNTNEYTLKTLQHILYTLKDEGLSQENINIYFSGTGYHIEIHKDCFAFEPDKELPYIVKETIKNLLGNDVDTSIYSRTGLYRIKNTKNQKSKLYKIPLTWEEVFTLSIKDIQVLAKNPRLDFPEKEFYGNEELIDKVITSVPSIKTLNTVKEPSRVVSCIQKMLKEGAIKGSRNNKILRIASHLRRNGIPSNSAKAMLLDWNNNSLEPDSVIERIESVYNANYKYGCNDALMKKYCDPKCIHYKRKDYLVEVYNSDDLQKELEKRLETDWSGKVLNLGKIFGLQSNKDSLAYPGELISIYGPTGVNKSALAQNIILGLDMDNNRIDKSLHIPTLYLSLELSGWMVHRRNLQIVSDQNKETISKMHKYYFDQHKDKLKHILIQTVAPTIDQIKKKIQHLQPQCVVIDYISQIETKYRSEYDQVREISHKLRNIATNLDTIIIQISQISRAYSREQVLDIFAGKGSGAIENASSKVIGINGKPEKVSRTIEMFKNSDGDLFRKEVFWTPSFRLLP